MGGFSGIQVEIRHNKLGTVLANLDPATKRRTRLLIDEVAALARQFAAVDTGFMRDHIEATADGVISLATYSVYVEYGTWKMRAQPFMRPAAARVFPTAYQKFEGFEVDLLTGFSGFGRGSARAAAFGFREAIR